MGREKGCKKTGGRKAGKGNRNLEPIREAFTDFVEHNLKNVQDNFDNLSDKDKLFFVLNFSEYCIPKLQRTELTGADGEDLIPTLSDEELLTRLNRISKSSKKS